MDIYELTGRNIEITEAMRNYTHDKLGKLDHFSDQIIDARVIMSYANHKHADLPAKVEVQLNLSQGVVRAEERGVDTYAATDLVVDKLDRQLKRFKERKITLRARDDAPIIMADAQDDVAEQDDSFDAADVNIVRIKRHAMRPMLPEDAAMEMDNLGHSFYVFRNMRSDDINVIYLRDDGNYGLIEPRN